MVSTKDTSAIERVNKAWDRIDNWYAKSAPQWTLPKGATDAEIDALAKQLNVTLPEELRMSLKRHNGVEDGKWPTYTLMSIKGIEGTWSWLTGDMDEGEFDFADKIESNGTYQAVFWCNKWVPIDGFEGTGSVIDLAPGPKGQVGQILYFSIEEGPCEMNFSDYPSYLEDIADQLEKGRFSVDLKRDILSEKVDKKNVENENDEEENDEDEDKDEKDEDEAEESDKKKKKVKK